MPKQISALQMHNLWNIVTRNIPTAAVADWTDHFRRMSMGTVSLDKNRMLLLPDEAPKMRVLNETVGMVKGWGDDYRTSLPGDISQKMNRINREAAATNTFYKALEKGDYATARSMVNEYPALGAVFASKMGTLKFRGSQQTSMQAVLGRGVASEGQSIDWRKEYAETAKNGLHSVTKMLNQHEATYLALYGCVITAMLQQILDITNAEITVAQYERLMSDAFNNSGAFSAIRKRRDAQGNYVRDKEGKIIRDRVAFSRDLFSESYSVNKEGAAVFGGDVDISVTRDTLADFFLESLKTLGVNTSGIQYVKGQNLNDYLQDYDVYASARSLKRGHDYGVYIPQGSVFNNLSDYYANNPEFFKDPLNWKSQNLERADIQGFFIRR